MKSARILFVTGTDTGVGKTVFAALATVRCGNTDFTSPRSSRFAPVGATMPASSIGPREKSCRSPKSIPGISAPRSRRCSRRGRKRNGCGCRTVVAHIRRIARRFEVVIVEGAGGLLSPLGEDFDSRDLIQALGAEADRGLSEQTRRGESGAAGVGGAAAARPQVRRGSCW